MRGKLLLLSAATLAAAAVVSIPGAFGSAQGGGTPGVTPRLVTIGPATSAELRARGAEPHIEADPHTPDGLVAALLADQD